MRVTLNPNRLVARCTCGHCASDHLNRRPCPCEVDGCDCTAWACIDVPASEALPPMRRYPQSGSFEAK